MQWFRMYAEAVDDDKLRLLAFEDRWHYVAILCLKSGGVLDSDPKTLDRRVALKLGLLAHDLGEVKRRLMEVGLIDKRWQPSGWGKRQFQSDTSAERTRQWRERHRDVTVTDQNRTDTESDTETDTEQKKSADALVFPNGFAMREWEEWIAHRKSRRMPCDRRTLQTQITMLAKYGHVEQAEMINRSINAGWQGIFEPRGNGAPRKPFKPKTPEELEALYGDQPCGK